MQLVCYWVTAGRQSWICLFVVHTYNQISNYTEPGKWLNSWSFASFLQITFCPCPESRKSTKIPSRTWLQRYRLFPAADLFRDFVSLGPHTLWFWAYFSLSVPWQIPSAGSLNGKFGEGISGGWCPNQSRINGRVCGVCQFASVPSHLTTCCSQCTGFSRPNISREFSCATAGRSR